MRRLHTRLLTAGALAALTVGGLAACTHDDKTFEDDSQLPQQITGIRLDNKNGNVEVDASAGTSVVSVHRKVSYHGDKPSGASFTVDNGVLTLSACGKNCGIDYVVKVPAGLPVSGSEANGNLKLTNVGPVDVHTGNGQTSVYTAKGPVKLRTSNGDVHVLDANGGAVDTESSNGGVTIQTATPQNVKARTTNGSLTVTAPPADYQVAANVSHGEQKVAFQNDPAAKYRLELSTTNGDLTVKSAG
ncbi:DUF4097 family beta strand repeat-containing protein [Yinghuangia seranimata]|uniref:DUF4097 family beta strand repeat-containing protein n=1 Tax=Yinghuangia seranimata TaxID=408067 RepID=UPI00248AF9F0|nr:DUF4097 family beta strand repeat-containing protein [Yinghuangia seranimata]MDI2125644.1 DUF4097 family beta strand repeat-containing protein [Yinghuangia seranimata]